MLCHRCRAITAAAKVAVAAQGRGRGATPRRAVGADAALAGRQTDPRLGAGPAGRRMGRRRDDAARGGKLDEIPFQPWARAVYDIRQIDQFEPHTRCKASGVSRQFSTPYGTEFVEVPDLQRMYIMDNGGPNSYRIIYLDGRSFPQNIAPTNYGYSIGHWEGDTLVVETRGLNEKFWMDTRGTPHTAQLKFTERFTRTDMNTLQVSGDDRRPGRLHQAVDDDRLQPALESRRRAVRVHLPAVQPGTRADAREPGRRGQHALLRALDACEVTSPMRMRSVRAFILLAAVMAFAPDRGGPGGPSPGRHLVRRLRDRAPRRTT